MNRFWLSAALVATAAFSGPVAAQENQGADAAATSAAATWTVNEILPLTCGQAWQMSGKSSPEFVRMLVALGGLSLQNRGLSLPDSARAHGPEIGMEIRKSCESDPDNLLYSVVDKSLRPYGVPATEP